MVISLTMKSEWEIIWNSLEQKAQNTMAHLSMLLGIWLDSVNNMHFKIHELSIDGVLRWSVEVILESVEVAAFNVLLEQANCGCSHEVVHWRVWAVQKNLNLLATLVEFYLVFWINLVVLEVKVVVFEILLDWHVGIEVDWSLQIAIADNITLFVIICKQISVGSHPVVLCEFTWSLVQGIQVILGVVIVGVARFASLGATWHTADDWDASILTLAHSWHL